MLRLYRADAASCQGCARKADGTTAPARSLAVSPDEAQVLAHRRGMTTEAAQTASRPRRGLIEGVFGTLKERRRGRRGRRRGLAQVQAEGSLLAAAFNLRTLVRWWQATGTPDQLPRGATGSPTTRATGAGLWRRVPGPVAMRPRRADRRHVGRL